MVILGLVQGLTEFLPVSSTAHLIFAEAFLGIPRPGILLEAVLHLGTALAALVVLWGEVRKLVTGWGMSITRKFPDATTQSYGRLAWLIILVTAITAAAGLTLERPLESMFGSVRGTAVQLILTGGLLLLAQERGRRAMLDATPADAVAIAVAQAIAIVPGISRSGATITAGMWMGLRKEEAARFSFLAAIPAVAGAGILGLKDLRLGLGMGDTPAQLLTGLAVAALSGGVGIRWLLSVLRRGRLSYFAADWRLVGAAVVFFTKGEELWRAGNGPPIVFMAAGLSRWAGGLGWRLRF